MEKAIMAGQAKGCSVEMMDSEDVELATSITDDIVERFGRGKNTRWNGTMRRQVLGHMCHVMIAARVKGHKKGLIASEYYKQANHL